MSIDRDPFESGTAILRDDLKTAPLPIEGGLDALDVPNEDGHTPDSGLGRIAVVELVQRHLPAHRKSLRSIVRCPAAWRQGAPNCIPAGRCGRAQAVRDRRTRPRQEGRSRYRQAKPVAYSG